MKIRFILLLLISTLFLRCATVVHGRQVLLLMEDNAEESLDRGYQHLPSRLKANAPVPRRSSNFEKDGNKKADNPGQHICLWGLSYSNPFGYSVLFARGRYWFTETYMRYGKAHSPRNKGSPELLHSAPNYPLVFCICFQPYKTNSSGPPLFFSDIISNPYNYIRPLLILYNENKASNPKTTPCFTRMDLLYFPFVAPFPFYFIEVPVTPILDAYFPFEKPAFDCSRAEQSGYSSSAATTHKLFCPDLSNTFLKHPIFNLWIMNLHGPP